MPERSDAPPLDAWLDAVTGSHQRLVTVVAGLTPEEVVGPSYDDEWSVAQVLSHLGSGGDIFSLFLRAGLGQAAAPGIDEFKPVWEEWDAKTPDRQAADALVSDRAFLDQLDALDEHQRESWELSMFGTDRTLNDLLQLRLSEHALHSWDVAVTRDDQATLAPDAVALLVDTLPDLVARLGRTSEEPIRTDIVTHQPDRRFRLLADPERSELRAVADGSAVRTTGSSSCRPRASCGWSTVASIPTTHRDRCRPAPILTSCAGSFPDSEPPVTVRNARATTR